MVTWVWGEGEVQGVLPKQFQNLKDVFVQEPYVFQALAPGLGSDQQHINKIPGHE